MLYYKTKFGCKLNSRLEDTTALVTYGLHKPMLWPWHWTQRTSFSARHSGLWCCITIPGLVTKCSVVQKILSGQAFTNILNCRCDLDLEHSNPIFPQDTLAYDAVLPNKLWLQTDKKLRRYNRNKSYSDNLGPLLWPWHWTQWTIFSARHSGLWCCITIPGLVTKYSVVQKILFGQMWK